MALTARQEAFATEFAKCRSPMKAFRVAYDCQDDEDHRVHKEAYAVLKTPAVKARIEELIDEAATASVFTVAEAIGRYLAIAQADPNELVAVRIGACRYCHGVDHRYHWREREYLEALDAAERDSRAAPDPGGGLDYNATAPAHPDCPECHGEGIPREVVSDTTNLSKEARLLYGGVKRTKEGLQVLIADRMKALEAACKLAGFFTDNVKVSGEVRKMAAIVTMEAADPQAAAKAYMELINGIATEG
jgi:phage terminase small subunit